MTKKTSSPNLSRREFTSIVTAFLGSIMGAVVGLPVIGYIISPAVKTEKVDDWVSLGLLDSYPIGTPTLFSFTRTKVNGWEKTANSYGVFVLRASESQVRVLSNVCTHLSCRVNWKKEAQSFECPCHDAHFDIDGKVLDGPPPRPMDEYERKIEDGNILVHLMEG
ncbi:MAG: Rieske 2Fe-2S domain-containing protein [Chloroflexi bacterium]|nr:Rieske 2Fe-2S domain-containing protein [Chloroflexota bacterium]MBU1661153.1 Rieske 2Fe-2S domain-containing protein [Chloroflexota bacterium]